VTQTNDPLFPPVPVQPGNQWGLKESYDNKTQLIVAKWSGDHSWDGQFLTFSTRSNLFSGGSSRGPHTNNPPDSTGWRYPSTFHREAATVRYLPTSAYWVLDPNNPRWTYPVDYEHQYGESQLDITSLGLSNSEMWGDFSQIDFGNNYNKAIASLYNDMNQDRSDWGTNILEAKKSVDDLANLTSTLVKSYKALRSRNVSMLAKALGNQTPKSVSGAAKAVADRYLSGFTGLNPHSKISIRPILRCRN